MVKFGKKIVSNELSFNNLQLKYSLDELKSFVKILVIDDHDIFPVKGFKEFGYSIEKWNKVTTPKLKQLHNGEFDIIILDIYGVAQEIAEQDGLDVLQDIKTHNPAQVVIAYSGQSFDFSKNKFWELADEKLGKPTPFIGTQSVIDNLIEKTFTIKYHQEKIEKVLSENNLFNELKKIQNIFVSYKTKKAEPNWISELEYLKLKNGESRKLASILSKLFKITKVK